MNPESFHVYNKCVGSFKSPDQTLRDWANGLTPLSPEFTQTHESVVNSLNMFTNKKKHWRLSDKYDKQKKRWGLQ